MEDLAQAARHLPALFLLGTFAFAQRNTAPEPAADPIAIVAAAEKQLQRPDKDVEAAVLMLWEALDLLAERPSNAVLEATTLSARYLLQQHDPREAERRTAFTNVAKLQVELAAAYRGKKWFDTAKTRLDLADRYDKDATAKERAALLAALPKPAANAPAPARPEAKAPALPASLQRSKAVFAHGDWREGADHLQSPAIPANDITEWVSSALHADHELVLEFQPLEPSKDHNIALCAGLHMMPGTNNYSGVRVQYFYNAKEKDHLLRIWQIVGMDTRELRSEWITTKPPADGWHRLALQVRGNALRVVFDECKAVAAEAMGDVRGTLGIAMCNPDAPSPALRIRTLRADPLPADAPTDDELRAAAEAARQNAITKAVEDAKALLAKKQPEPAAQTLRDALTEIRAMAPGVLRDNLKKTVTQMLGTADALTQKRMKTAADLSASLLALANQYATAGQVRCALVMTQHAALFDSDGGGPALAKAEEAVRQWNLDQAQKRAAELAPPTDDGALLKQWFATGTLLDSRQPQWTHGEPFVSLLDCKDRFSVLMPKRDIPALGKARVHVRLPANDCYAGFAFDVVGPGEYSLATIERRAKGLLLAIDCYKDGKWRTPGQRAVPIDAWRLDGWFAVELHETPAAITLKAAGAELQLDRTRLQPIASRFGLCAGNSTDAPRTIELRAFTLPQ